MAADFLKQILDYKKQLLQEKQTYFAGLKKKLEKEKINRYRIFKKAIEAPDQINLIAEIKKASPSKGLIRAHFDVLQLAKIYSDSGAAALSILTEDKFFLGKPAFIKMVSEKFALPILTKDFILDQGQIYEAFVQGASAILLIVTILEPQQLKQLMQIADRLDIDCLVEVHDEAELKTALAAGAEIIGINNRNLRTFEIDLGVTKTLVKKIPTGKVIVSESGFQSHTEIEELKNLGVNAVLIGETFLKAPDIRKKIKDVMHG